MIKKKLHETKLFSSLIERISLEYGIQDAIIEKDYFVSLFLKNLVEREPNIIFKGGTSLSKCFGVIERFSEDIDLNFDNGTRKATIGQRRKVAKEILDNVQHLGFFCNKTKENTQTHRLFNLYEIDYEAVYHFSHNDGRSVIKVETAYFIPSFPTEKREVTSLIYNYLKAIDRNDIIEMYELSPFLITVQSLNRTFVDKVFTICDYYLETILTNKNKIVEHSRHLYDIHKLYLLVSEDTNLKKLIQEVRSLRKGREKCYSASEKEDVEKLLQEIVKKDVYKIDYEKTTIPFLYEQVSYEETIETIKQIIESKIFSSE